MLGSHSVTIAGQERRLTYGFRELRYVEERTGYSFLTGKPGHVPLDSLAFFLVLLTAGLMRDGNPSLAEAEDILDGLTQDAFEDLSEAMRMALDASVFAGKGDAPADPR